MADGVSIREHPMRRVRKRTAWKMLHPGIVFTAKLVYSLLRDRTEAVVLSSIPFRSDYLWLLFRTTHTRSRIIPLRR